MNDVLETGGLIQDVLDTPELETPPVEPDAHRGVIDGVTVQTFETGSTGIKFSLTSTDGGFQTDYTVFPPVEFVQDIALDPTTLGEVPAEGKKQSPKQRYAAVVANKDKTAELQNFRKIAYEAGRSLEGAVAPTDFNEYIELYNNLLSGVEIVFTRTADNSSENPAFRNRLKVNRIMSASVVNDPKALKKYKKLWLQQ